MRRTSVPSWGKVGILLLLPLVLLVIPTTWLERAPSACLIRRITGRPCPGCGMTRALSSVAHGHFKQGYQHNKRVIIVAPLLGYAWMRSLLREYRRPISRVP
jgi:hypothetical protein